MPFPATPLVTGRPLSPAQAADARNGREHMLNMMAASGQGQPQQQHSQSPGSEGVFQEVARPPNAEELATEAAFALTNWGQLVAGHQPRYTDDEWAAWRSWRGTRWTAEERTAWTEARSPAWRNW